MDADSVRSSKKIKGLRRWGRPSDGRSRRRATTRKSRPGGTEGAVEADWPGVDAGGVGAQRNKETTFLRLEFRASGARDEGGLDLSHETFFCSGVFQGKVSSLYGLPRGCSVTVVVPSFGVRVVLY
ncbi:hypothetical protein B296_00025302 [Ensete ventricosum]|uniref:Uncharacterized protein n=1 Tax=Ensete ventricosum TaxID=4639 RepID=A0A426XA83_ENSVE|nr:hypothetical protein B296_00025302 [Ensete ventricosum]